MDFFKNIFERTPISKKIGFEDMKIVLNSRINGEYILINTMPIHFQNNLILGTINGLLEESIINRFLDNYEMKRIKIVLYGMNSQDNSPEKKSEQFASLGFTEIYIYTGGMFEWLLLQELYSDSEFPTTGKTKFSDILNYKGTTVLSTVKFITNY
jgi:hypothetical protein